MGEIALTVPAIGEDLAAIKALVLDGLTSPHSKAMYSRALDDFLGWYAATGRQRLDKAAVQSYKAKLLKDGLAPATVNQKLSAIRKLTTEAADNGLMDPNLAAAIGRVPGVKIAGVRTGNWLTQDQAQQLLNLPDISTLKGLRDRAILSTMLGCGLRRAEVASLTLADVQQREGRWVIVDMVGKGGRVRSVPMPSWCRVAIAEWTNTAALTEGRVFRSIHKGGFLTGQSLSPQAVADVVKHYAGELGGDLAAHDLRRSFAKLAHKGMAKLEQIQLSLGHSSIQTTERYLGVQQDLTDAPCDHLGLRLD